MNSTPYTLRETQLIAWAHCLSKTVAFTTDAALLTLYLHVINRLRARRIFHPLDLIPNGYYLSKYEDSIAARLSNWCDASYTKAATS